MTDSLLAERELLGYPGATVSLHVCEDGYEIVVQETRWRTADRKDAKDRYFHPFCYGFDYTPVRFEDD